ncbi:hypothetical protein ASG31_15735 [Chryseobacterium sp. Leaf404]|uniref:hypothetical protein n=1 Tax=unclassified Chryseobacterium TaxID=2593645 RepID=UPI0007014735|nr:MULTISPECIES: hypothetical protein [unclassified Chryseobacterium]KQT15051.1 hypothetical protein ASG31_15735 [Chryseobacterium sp. Leaf404]
MKISILILTALSTLAFGQEKRNSDLKTKDSVAVSNVNSILFNSKKSLPSLKADLHNSPEMKKNVNQLNANTINFNTVMNGQYIDQMTSGTMTRPRVDAIHRAGRTVLSVPVYKTK